MKRDNENHGATEKWREKKDLKLISVPKWDVIPPEIFFLSATPERRKSLDVDAFMVKPLPHRIEKTFSGKYKNNNAKPKYISVL